VKRGLKSLALIVAGWAPATAATAVTCSAQSGSVVFGTYDPLSPRALDGVGRVNIDCDAPTSFTIGLGPGGGSFDERRMTGGQSQLVYNLYSDATRLIVWGDGEGASSLTAGGGRVDLPVYGRIPAHQNVVAGVYGDTITITITY